MVATFALGSNNFDDLVWVVNSWGCNRRKERFESIGGDENRELNAREKNMDTYEVCGWI